MREPSAAFILVLSTLSAACARAEFSPVDADASNRPPETGGTSSCGAPSVNACVPKIAAGAPCDSVCQTGSCDWCSQKCTLAGDGSTVCSAAGDLLPGSACTVSLAGTDRQYDNCAAGSICLVPELGSGLSYCFALCRSSIDCPGGVACSERVLAAAVAPELSVKVCDPPYRSCAPASPQPCCDPLGSVSGCGVGQFCYLVPPDPSHDNRTVCDYTTGAGGRSSQCNSSSECMPGWTCYGATTGTVGVCRKACDPRATNPCGVGGGACGDYGNQYGVCAP